MEVKSILKYYLKKEELSMKFAMIMKKYKKDIAPEKREMRPVGAYELKLAAIKFEIAEIIQKDNKKEAIEELKSALQILDKHGRGRLAEKIVELLSKLT